MSLSDKRKCWIWPDTIKKYAIASIGEQWVHFSLEIYKIFYGMEKVNRQCLLIMAQEFSDRQWHYEAKPKNVFMEHIAKLWSWLSKDNGQSKI